MRRSKLVADVLPDPPDWQSLARQAGYRTAAEPQVVGVEFTVRQWADFQGHITVGTSKRFLDGEVAAGRMTGRRTLLPNGRVGAVYRLTGKGCP